MYLNLSKNVIFQQNFICYIVFTPVKFAVLLS